MHYAITSHAAHAEHAMSLGAATSQLLCVPQAAAQVDMWAGAAVAQGSSRHLEQQPAPLQQAGPHLLLLWYPQVCYSLGVPGILLHHCTFVSFYT